MLARCRQQGQQRLVNEHPAVVAVRADDFPENNRLTKRVLGSVVPWRDRWLTDEGEPVVDSSVDLHALGPTRLASTPQGYV